MIERFTKDEFDNAIDEICTELNLWHYGSEYIEGEWCWSIKLDDKTFLAIRSSIGMDYIAKDTGDDSIRLTLHSFRDGILGKDAARWITRVKGWDKRLFDAISRLAFYRAKAFDCPVCNKPKHIYKVRKEGSNKGRLFAKCNDENHKRESWVWLTEKGE